MWWRCWASAYEGLNNVDTAMIRENMGIDTDFHKHPKRRKCRWQAQLESRAIADNFFVATKSSRATTAVGSLPTYANSGWPAPRFMKLGLLKAGARHRLLPLHHRRPDRRGQRQLRVETTH